MTDVTPSTPGVFVTMSSTFARSIVIALERGSIGQLQAGVNISLVFIGQEAFRQTGAEPQGQHRQADEQRACSNRLCESANRTDAYVAVCGPPKHAIEPAEELRPDGPRPSFLGCSSKAESAGLR